ncbi:glycosyltransferase [Confluentibacter citreus]|uniref:glycosyltransferase n=1 Tax=Confluentibacter citreus TaxID=2007307 RepID=UPI000C288B7A|nr:glycosyltransferase [Confluentibacter citreus]
MKLVIISHTEHYCNANGVIVGWGPTINEINHLIEDFDKITHIAMLHTTNIPQSSMPYMSSKINFIPIPVLGGNTLFSKLKLLLYTPIILKIVFKEIIKADIFQLRTPTGIGVYLIPFLTLFINKKGWYKYAGNWKQKNPPLGYLIQRWMLKKQTRIVTINGQWENQSKNIVAFENPCLTNEDRILGKRIIYKKELTKKMDYCFVGELNYNKGIDKIIEAFTGLSNDYIGTLHIVGNGQLKEEIENKAKLLAINVKVYGALHKSKVYEVYKNSHFIILPSKNEGFPKVIGEAMNFGCVPIVSDISCINQYIENERNGFLIRPNTVESLKKIIIEKIFYFTNEQYKLFVKKNYVLANKFTYEYYKERLNKEIINKKTSQK